MLDSDFNFLDIENESDSNLRGSRMDGYLYKHEQRPIVGLIKKKFWFVLPKEAPVLYWYKSPNDFNCAGRIVLSGAAFTFNPRDWNI